MTQLQKSRKVCHDDTCSRKFIKHKLRINLDHKFYIFIFELAYEFDLPDMISSIQYPHSNTIDMPIYRATISKLVKFHILVL